MPIRSMRCIYLRALLRSLGRRGTKVHQVAEAIRCSPAPLLRLVEFGSKLDPAVAGRLVAFARAELQLRTASEIRRRIRVSTQGEGSRTVEDRFMTVTVAPVSILHEVRP
jgi:hypothetical protein